MKNYIISEELKNALLTYLAQRPYSEVARAIMELSSLKGIVAPTKEEEK